MRSHNYRDKHGNKIEAGMIIKHNKGDVEKVYENWDGDDIGINATNSRYQGNMMPQIYPLSQFDLREWEIVDGEKGDNKHEES